MLEEEIDSSLGFLRYDYPEAVYSELRKLFRQALYEQQDLSAMAQKLAAQLSAERKIMLGVQLYDLISQAGLKQEQVVAFYSFMSQLGMAAQAIDIVYQLNAAEDADAAIYQRGASPLESLSFGTNGAADVTLKSLTGNDRLARLPLSRSDPAQELQGQTHLGPRAGRSCAGVFAAFIRASASCSATRFSPTRTSRLTSTRRKTSRSRRSSCASTRMRMKCSWNARARAKARSKSPSA